MGRGAALLIAAASATLWTGLVSPDTAAASCAESPDRPVLAEHDSVFAGHVERTTNGGAAAEVTVLDIWHGPDLPKRVVVVGGQLGRGVASSVDRSYRADEQYAFFVLRAEDGSLQDNICTPTAPLSSLSEVDPRGHRLPTASADAPTDPRGALASAGLPVVAAAVLSAAVGVAALVRRRRRPR